MGVVPLSLQKEHKGKRVVLYPAYFDSRLSRSRGRRVPRELAVKDPRPEEIAAAARSLGLEAYVEPGKYPRVWWVWNERIIVEKKYNKSKLIKIISKKILENRRRK